ncbi:Myb-like DNA-binding domain family protein [Aspergillus niger]|uniref:Myb-like DNA-binding domain family protein n=1 Tax=Aspergillus niger TaxID=5061 RepID=A0A505I0A0_ASPNG|nr:Myb-like DNA-binding domain family protein [Aspergillus niger]
MPDHKKKGKKSGAAKNDSGSVIRFGEELEYPDKHRADVPTGDVTDRIAVVNLDWDNIRAEDLMAVFSSFAPTGGKVLKVAVYPSEFGKERMEREETEGPPREIFASKKGGDSDDEDEMDSDEEEENIRKSMLKEDKGEEFNSTQLRKYQLERLRYFYAILTFSSRDVAKHVYDLVDGAEYLSSANFFDLRFVPEDTDFSDDTPRDECERIPDGYQPNEFVTDALQHSKVKLTWDMEDKSRKEAQARAFRGSRKDIDENDLKAYLASDSSDDEEDEGGVEIVDTTRGDGETKKVSKKEEEKQRLRALLGLGAEPTPSSKSDGPVGEMEVTFTSGLAGGPKGDSIFENEPEKDETTIEKYIRKERERKKRRKEKLKATKRGEDGEQDEAADASDAKEQPQQDDLGFDDPFFDDPTGKATEAARRKEEKRKKREELPTDDFEMEVTDPRFARLYESHEFAIDPTNPRFKATSGMKALLEEGRKRRRDRDEHADEEDALPG